MQDAVQCPGFHDCIAAAAEHTKPHLASKNLQRDICRVALACQLSSTAIDVVEFESVRSINLVPTAARASGLASR